MPFALEVVVSATSESADCKCATSAEGFCLDSSVASTGSLGTVSGAGRGKAKGYGKPRLPAASLDESLPCNILNPGNSSMFSSNILRAVNIAVMVAAAMA